MEGKKERNGRGEKGHNGRKRQKIQSLLSAELGLHLKDMRQPTQILPNSFIRKEAILEPAS
jgi:hypothetical protein